MKRRRILAVLFAVTMLCALAAPAIAGTNANYSASDSGSGLGHTWSSSLTTTSRSASAQIRVTPNTTGHIPAYVSAKLVGNLYTAGRRTISLYDQADAGDGASAVAFDSFTVPPDEEVIGASCTYYAMGRQAGQELIVGRTP